MTLSELGPSTSFGTNLQICSFQGVSRLISGLSGLRPIVKCFDVIAYLATNLRISVADGSKLESPASASIIKACNSPEASAFRHNLTIFLFAGGTTTHLLVRSGWGNATVPLFFVESEQVTERIAVMDAGLMGHGIAQLFAAHGHSVSQFDVSADALAKARLEIEGIFNLLGQDRAVAGAVTFSTDLQESVAEADVLIQAAPEKTNLKQEIFQSLDAFCRSEAPLGVEHLRHSDHHDCTGRSG